MLMLTIGATSVLAQTNITSLSQITDANGSYIITQDISGGTTGVTTFSGTLTAQANNDGTYPVISNITQPLFATATNATISNIMFKGISISGSGNIGAICGTANGATRIYNCGILPTSADATSTPSIGSTDGYCGSLVLLTNPSQEVGFALPHPRGLCVCMAAGPSAEDGPEHPLYRIRRE